MKLRIVALTWVFKLSQIEMTEACNWRCAG
jgi:hypothetical protein